MADRPIPAPALLVPEQSVLVVIDVQARLLSAMPDNDARDLLTNSKRLIKAAERLRVPVLISEQYPKGLGASHPDIVAVLPAGVQCFEKTAFSCAGAPGFFPALHALGRSQIALIGQETHVCVLQTAFDLLSGGYHVFIVDDAVCSRSVRHRDNAFARMQQAGAIVINHESVVFEWLGDARHPDFKTLSVLIK